MKLLTKPGMIALLILLAASVPDAEQACASGIDVRFSVDLSLEQSMGRFDPVHDVVAVHGDHPALGSWTGTAPVLEQSPGGSGSYQGWVRFEGLTVGEPVAYKFVLHYGGDPEDVMWEENIVDRSFVATGNEPDDMPPSGGDGYPEISLPSTYFGRESVWTPADRMLGADISFVPQLQSLGAVYYAEGGPVEPLDALRERGYRVVRLRLWHSPDEPWHGLDATVDHAALALAAGHEIMLDIHYSDTWADPGHQQKPEAWEGIGFSSLVDSVYEYTNTVVRRFRDEGIVPAYVQVGNEISGGMLWDDGRVGGAWDTPEQWSNLGTLLDACARAVRDSLPVDGRPRVVIHVDNGGSNELCRWFFDNLVAEGVEFDAIGVSFYPWWHGTLWDLRDNLRDLATAYGKELLVVETAYPWTLAANDATGNFVESPDDLHPGYDATPEGQAAFLQHLLGVVEGVPGGLGGGVVYWEPGFLTVPGGPGNPYENLTLFDFDGQALPGLGFALPWETDVPEGDTHGSLPLLAPCAPNPFGSFTRIDLAVPSGGAEVDVSVYDVAGRRVTTLASGFLVGGTHELSWSGTGERGVDSAAGVYFCRAEVDGWIDAVKLVLLR